MFKNIFLTLISAMVLTATFPAHAAGVYDLKEITPAVGKALDGRRARYGALQELKAQGIVGENNRGYVEVLKTGSAAEGVVASENADRSVIYRTIVEQNGLGDALATVEQVFAEVQRGKAAAGDKIQMEDGTWVTK